MIVAARVRCRLVSVANLAAGRVAESEIGGFRASIRFRQKAARVLHRLPVYRSRVINERLARGYAGVAAARIGDAGQPVNAVVGVAGNVAHRVHALDEVAPIINDGDAGGVGVVGVRVGGVVGLGIGLRRHASQTVVSVGASLRRFGLSVLGHPGQVVERVISILRQVTGGGVVLPARGAAGGRGDFANRA